MTRTLNAAAAALQPGAKDFFPASCLTAPLRGESFSMLLAPQKIALRPVLRVRSGPPKKEKEGGCGRRRRRSTGSRQAGEWSPAAA